MNNSKKIIVFLLGVIASLLLFVKVNTVHAEMKVIESISVNQAMEDSGMSHGQNHDRQDLGKIMKKGSQLKINSYGEATLWLLTADSDTEKSYKLDETEQTITADVDCTPFITTPRGNQDITVNYEFLGDTVSLPTYNTGDDANAFLNQWESTKAPYGLFKGKKFQLYLPIDLLDKIKNMSAVTDGHKDIPDMMDYYDNRLIPTYEELTGLDGLNMSDRNYGNRYFLKNDAHGVGGAYYSSNWTADSYQDGDGWLQDGWKSKHEIGHGFQNNLMRQMGMGEVSNNILATYYDYHVNYGMEADEKSWIYDYGKKDEIESGIFNALEKNTRFKDLDVRQKLVLIYFMMDRLGKDGIANINKMSRDSNLGKSLFSSEENVRNYILKEGYQQNLDYSKVVNEYGLDISANEYGYSGYANRKQAVVDTIANLVKPENREAYLEKLSKTDKSIISKSSFNIVTPSQLAPLNVTRDIRVDFDAKIPDDYIGTNLNLYDGEKLVATKKIENSSGVTFEQIPLGTYRVALESEKPGTTYSNRYVSSSENDVTNRMSISDEGLNTLSMNNTIDFQGYSDVDFMKVRTYINSNNVNYSADFFEPVPHTYYGDEKYAAVSLERDKEELLDKVIFGNSTDLFYNQGSFLPDLDKEEVVFEIFHAEPDHRLKVTNVIGKDLTDHTGQVNLLQLTKQGIANAILNNNVDEDFKEVITTVGDACLQDSTVKEYKTDIVANLYRAIKTLPTGEQQEYLDKYQVLFDAK